ncbi:hypothetical protein Ptr902_06937 [Pyrenophora tritici-repentis]|nr:hypothetical protein Ptr902_06937 [Pyrenophora tritici-repentis]
MVHTAARARPAKRMVNEKLADTNEEEMTDLTNESESELEPITEGEDETDEDDESEEEAITEEEDATDDEEMTEVETDEEDDEKLFEKLFTKARKHYVRQEANADRIEDYLDRKPWKKVPLVSLKGKWTLYSSAYLDCMKRKIPKWGPRKLEDFDIGPLRMSRSDDSYSTMVGADLSGESDFTFFVSERVEFDFKAPKWASTRPMKIGCLIELGSAHNMDEKSVNISVMFLGPDVFKITFRSKDLPSSRFQGYDEITFVARRIQTQAQVREEQRKASAEWANCRYTGHLHPSNWGF